MVCRSIASVVAMTINNAIQVVVIPERTHSRQGSREDFLGAASSRLRHHVKKMKRRDSTESRRRRTTRKLMKKSLLLLLRGGLLGCGLLRGLLLSCHFHLPPSPMMRTRGSLTPRVASQSLTDKNFATLAVVCDDTLTRVGSVASVVATTSSIAIQYV
jgi:hypothetical protein